MKKYTHIYALLLLFVLNTSCKGQDKITTTPGTSITSPGPGRDKKGNIWFGTKDGASRYDGRSFQNFSVKAGLPFESL